jgi:uracil-DNA glycosylase family 4
VFGMGSPSAGLMFVGEGPGEQEDRQGLPFVGRSGQLLDRLILEEMGLTRDSVYIANTIKCRPPGNRDPLPEELEACWPYLEVQLEQIDPKVVVTLGNFATKRLLGTTEGISRLRGRTYPYRSGYLVPTFHPSAALRGGGQVVAQMRADFVRAKEALHSAPTPRARPPQTREPKGAAGAPQAALAGEHAGRGTEPLL